MGHQDGSGVAPAAAPQGGSLAELPGTAQLGPFVPGRIGIGIPVIQLPLHEAILKRIGGIESLDALRDFAEFLAGVIVPPEHRKPIGIALNMRRYDLVERDRPFILAVANWYENTVVAETEQQLPARKFTGGDMGPDDSDLANLAGVSLQSESRDEAGCCKHPCGCLNCDGGTRQTEGGKDPLWMLNEKLTPIPVAGSGVDAQHTIGAIGPDDQDMGNLAGVSQSSINDNEAPDHNALRNAMW